MPVSGLVVTLASPGTALGTGSPPGSSPGGSLEGLSKACAVTSDSPAEALPGLTAGGGTVDLTYPEVIEQIQQHPNFQAGPRHNQRLPVVLDTPDKETDKQCWGWINELPGVHHVDVAFIHFEDEDALDASPCSANADRPIAAPTIGET